MSALVLYSKEIASLLAPVVTWLLTRYFSQKAALLLDFRHQFTFLLNEPTRAPDGRVLGPVTTVKTLSTSVFNNGRATATKLEVVFNWRPQHFNIWPVRHYEERTSPDGRFSLLFENLTAKEAIGFELLSVNADLPGIIQVRSEQGVAKVRQLTPFPLPPPWKIKVALILMGFGVGAVVYLFISGLQLIARTSVAS
ncbi:hypothetical protein ACE7GA_01390 [Roseomonas sp. CCTCC AB2023176]|uniref:hypothetical protein n=1 Tax=Roseomonas sp. CCTCC AB2023176 TaxID=3342640 RepID=UPI0035D95B44